MVFDACHAGVVLRAVLFVQVVVGIGAMFGADSFLDWATRLALATGGTLPGTLLWLIAACSLKKLLAPLPEAVQWGAGTGLGAVAGLYGCAMLWMVGQANPAPWVASAFAGALLAAAGVLLLAIAVSLRL